MLNCGYKANPKKGVCIHEDGCIVPGVVGCGEFLVPSGCGCLEIM
jgi:hypothetical protein